MSDLDPLSVVLRVPLGGPLGETLSRVRIWLDGQKIHRAQFKTALDTKGYTYTISFVSIEDADRFRGQFGVLSRTNPTFSTGEKK